MSFLGDTVLPGSTRLYIGGKIVPGKDGGRTLRKSQSHAGLLSPLVQLIRDPLKTIGGPVSNAECIRIEALDPDADRKQLLHLHLRNAETYEEWKTAATELDRLEGSDVWKSEDESSEYDFALVAARLKQLDDARISCDVKQMLFLIRTSLTRGLGGMGDIRLYKHSHVGTKSLIERYIDSAHKTLRALLEVSAKQGDSCPVEAKVLEEKLLCTRQSFGRSALLLSGGGTFGMNHIGVVKCLWQARLLPRIISGTSAGSIVCAVLCTKTDAEIPVVLEEFCYGDLDVFEKEGQEDGLLKKVTRFLKYGALFDISHLVGVMRNLLGDITFQEAYNRTRKILNITVSSASLYELPRLLNYVTAPNVMIWSAVCASCSVPFIFSPASLLAKDPKTGKEVPWNPNPNAGWIDGSVDNDLPMTRLAEMFNVNHFIVSQVNPHVVPFLEKHEQLIGVEVQQGSAFSAGPTWIHRVANLARGEALHRLHVLSEMGVFPNHVTKVRSVLNQRYSGDITIFPSISYAHFPKVLSNPTTDYMLQCMLTGERATWPKLSRIQNHLALELAIDDTLQQLRTRVVFSPSQIDLRMNNLNRPLSQGNDQSYRFAAAKPLYIPTRLQRDSAPFTLSPTVRRRTNKARVGLPSSHVARPYLPTTPPRKHTGSLDYGQPSNTTLDALSSSPNPGGSSSDDELSADSDISDLLSSPSPPRSPSSSLPNLWPTTRQLFPSASQPSTPSSPATMPAHRNSSLLNLTMTSSYNPRATHPGSPELRYKRLFHVPTGAALQKEMEETGQPLTQGAPTVRQIETLSEFQSAPPAGASTDSLLEAQMSTMEDWTMINPELSPLSTRDIINSTATPTAKLPPRDVLGQERREPREPERNRQHKRQGSDQGAGLGLALDISGTRGMMLRKKKSSKNLSPST